MTVSNASVSKVKAVSQLIGTITGEAPSLDETISLLIKNYEQSIKIRLDYDSGSDKKAPVKTKSNHKSNNPHVNDMHKLSPMARRSNYMAPVEGYINWDRYISFTSLADGDTHTISTGLHIPRGSMKRFIYRCYNFAYDNGYKASIKQVSKRSVKVQFIPKEVK